MEIQICKKINVAHFYVLSGNECIEVAQTLSGNECIEVAQTLSIWKNNEIGKMLIYFFVGKFFFRRRGPSSKNSNYVGLIMTRDKQKPPLYLPPAEDIGVYC